MRITIERGDIMQGATIMEMPGMMAFASGTYMLRSEKRRHYEPPVPEKQPLKKEPKPPKKKKPKVSKEPQEPKEQREKRTEAGFIYKTITVFFGILIWPVGLILLLRRYLKWKPYAKFIAALLLLCASVILYGFLLTVDTGNPEYTRVQDTINNEIEKLYTKAEAFAEIAADKMVEVRDGADNLGRALGNVAAVHLADAIDAGVELSWQAREKIAEWTGSEAVARPTPTPEPTPAPTPKPTEEPMKVRPGSGHAALDASSVVLPLYVPEGGADHNDGKTIVSGVMTHKGLSPYADVITGTGADSDIIRSFTVKSAGSVKVYCNFGSGEFYHTKESCGSMKTAQAHTLKEAVAEGMKPCERCKPIPAEMQEIDQIAWKDANDRIHTTDKCEAFNGAWTLITAEEVIEKGYAACEVCGCDDYIEAIRNGETITVVPLEQFS